MVPPLSPELKELSTAYAQVYQQPPWNHLYWINHIK